MNRLRSSMVLLSICVGAILIGVLRLATEQTALPPASSYSGQPDGAMALYDWLGELGAVTDRLRTASPDASTLTLLILQPESVIDSQARAAFDSVAQRGGTLVLAGDSLPWLVYARSLGVTVEPVASDSPSVSSADGLTVPFAGRYRLRADGAEPLLTRSNGDWVALRMPYKQGTLIVVASVDPFTNAGLADEQTARFVFRDVVGPASAQPVAFDEVHHSFAPTAAGPATADQLLFGTPPGHAVVYLALLTFVFLLLSGRRLGPALTASSAAESQRSMYEHVQMLGDLYRRARQLAVAREAFARHYARLAARGSPGSKQTSAYAEAVAQLQAAHSESELIAVLAAVDESR